MNSLHQGDAQFTGFLGYTATSGGLLSKRLNVLSNYFSMSHSSDRETNPDRGPLCNVRRMAHTCVHRLKNETNNKLNRANPRVCRCTVAAGHRSRLDTSMPHSVSFHTMSLFHLSICLLA
jgi:hypothetical protein